MMLKSYAASVASHLCPVASSLVVVRTYVNGLLSFRTVNLFPYKYSWYFSLMAHFN